MSKKVNRYLQQLLPPMMPSMVILVALAFIRSSIHIGIVAILRHAIDHYLTLPGRMLILMLCLCVGLVIVNIITIRSYFNRKEIVIQKNILAITLKLMDKANRIDQRVFEEKKGEWLTLTSSDCQEVAGLVPNTILQGISGGLKFLIVIIYSAFLSWKVMLCILGLSALSIFINKFFEKRIDTAQHSQKNQEEEMQNDQVVVLRNIPLIRGYKAGQKILEMMDAVYRKYISLAKKKMRAEGAMISTNIGVGLFTNTIWLIIAILFVFTGDLSVGSLFVFMTFGDVLSWPLMELPDVIATFYKNRVSLMRVVEFIGTNEIEGSNEEKVIKTQESEYRIKNLHYAYDDIAVLNIDELNIPLRGHICITGGSGTGKSTLMKLLSGLYSSGKAVSLLHKGQLYHGACLFDQVSYVPQTSMIFTGTIKDNILAGSTHSSVTQEDVIVAAKMADAHDFIMKLPDQYDYVLASGDKSNLSDGQLQRISIARAYMKDAPVLLMDEFTANLDKGSEERIAANLKRSNRCIISVAHKQGIIASSDVVIDLEKINKINRGEKLC